MNTQHLTPQELLDVNGRCRQYAGKPLEQCTHEDITRVRAGLAIEMKFLHIAREETILDIQYTIEHARRRREGTE